MTEPADMSHPVTRVELREELATYPTRAELREELATYPTREELRETLREELATYPTREELRETLREELAKYPTREELRETLRGELAKYPTREELHHELAGFATKADLELWGSAIMERTSAEIRTEVRAIKTDVQQVVQAALEQFQSYVRTSTEPYQDLPGRVTRLEAKVFPPRRARARR